MAYTLITMTMRARWEDAMTEGEWLECNDPALMLEYLDDRVSERKLCLFACACCYRTWHLLQDERSRKAVEVAERFCEGAATEHEIRVAREAASEAAGLGRFGGDDSWQRDSFAAGLESAAKAAAWAVTWDGCGYSEVSDAAATAAVPTWADRGEEFRMQAAILRDIIGNPFQHVAIDPAWHTPKVVSLARAIYDCRACERLSSLADALEETGCSNADILDHCRGPGPHVKGCWLVDLLLGGK
jgi:hypothetical protein